MGGDGREVYAFGQMEARIAVHKTWTDEPFGRPRRRDSRDTVDEIELGISGEPSGLANIISRSLR